MKFIFDFDDVVFRNTDGLKERMYSVLTEEGISRDKAEKYYKKIRGKMLFSLKNFIAHLLGAKNKKDKVDSVYKKIMKYCSEFLNPKIVEILKKAGRENCFLVTSGEEEFQMDKIRRSGADKFFNQISVVSGSKKHEVEKICFTYPEEKVFFIDDKEKFFEDLDFDKCKNLAVVHFNRDTMTELSRLKI